MIIFPIVYLTLTLLFTPTTQLLHAEESIPNSNIPICDMMKANGVSSFSGGNDIDVAASAAEVAPSVTSNPRIVAIADIHGAYDELMRILNGAGIINGSACHWLPQATEGTTLVQLGDIVDRGPGASEAWQCLEELQKNAPAGSEVIRLVGNHELWWLEGRYHDRNKVTDSLAVCQAITQKLRDGITDQSIIASYVHEINTVPVMFVHAGFRKDMITYLKNKYSISGTAEELSQVSNQALRYVVTSQAKASTVQLTPTRQSDQEIFEAGPERGGSHIGGPFWTDFRVLQKEFDNQVPREKIVAPNMMQVVGHTAQPGSIRATKDLSVLCIDAAMYMGTSTFLEIGNDAHFRIHVWNENAIENAGWRVQDVTSSVCQSDK